MLYIVSQNGLRITDLHAISVIIPEHDREDDGVYKVFVNGSEFAKYEDKKHIDWIMKEIQKFIHMNENHCFRLPNEKEEPWVIKA